MLSRFLRSEIQATDSTLMGCRANSAATTKLGPTESGRPQQYPEQQKHIHYVQHDIGLMMPPGSS